MNLESMKQRAPAAKAKCERCSRPLSILKNASCIYCGHINQSVLIVVDPKASEEVAADSSEAALAMTGPASMGGSTMLRWTVRIGALGLGGLLVWAFIGPCMRS